MQPALETPEAVAARIERAFDAVRRERMAGVPILNPALRVAAVGTRRWGDHWLAILVTPWCMNILLLPAPADARWPELMHGQTRHHALPGGTFAFILGEEPQLGRFEMCSLFSPMLQFADQDAALATAQAAIAELLTPPSAPAAPPPSSYSRRRLFGLAADQAEPDR